MMGVLYQMVVDRKALKVLYPMYIKYCCRVNSLGGEPSGRWQLQNAGEKTTKRLDDEGHSRIAINAIKMTRTRI